MNKNAFSFFDDVKKAVLCNLNKVSRSGMEETYLNLIVEVLYKANGQGYNYLKPLKMENLFPTVVSRIVTVSRYSKNIGWVHESNFHMSVTVDSDNANRSATTNFVLNKEQFDNTWLFNKVLVNQTKVRRVFEENNLKPNNYFFDELLNDKLREDNDNTLFSLFGSVEYDGTSLVSVTTTLVPKPKVTDFNISMRKLANE